MTTGERIKDLCDKNGITVAKLEKELGFSNGSILKNEFMRSDRLSVVADFFGVSMDFLMGKETQSYYSDTKTAIMAQELFENKDMRVLFDAAQDAEPEDLQAVYNMLLALKRKERRSNDE